MAAVGLEEMLVLEVELVELFITLTAEPEQQTIVAEPLIGAVVVEVELDLSVETQVPLEEMVEAEELLQSLA
jgi:hypothetical protein